MSIPKVTLKSEDLNTTYIINPFIRYYTLFRKVSTHIIKRGKIPVEVHSLLYSYPVYLPEIDYMILLDISSERLNQKILSEFSSYSGLKSVQETTKVFVATLYNANDSNRAVTWGNIQNYEFSKKHKNLYTSFYYLVQLSLRITPSTIVGHNIFSPNRWAMLTTETKNNIFSTMTTLNVFPVYITKEALERVKETREFLPLPLTLYKVEATALEFLPNGTIHLLDIPLYFVESPSEDIIFQFEGNGEYYLVHTFSFIDAKFSQRSGTSIHLVENIMPLYPVDILLGLVTKYINKKSLNKLIWKLDISESSLSRIRKILAKHSSSISPTGSWIDAISSEFYPYFNITETDNKIRIDFINPGALIYFFRWALFNERNPKYLEVLIYPNELFKVIEEYEKIQQKKDQGSLLELMDLKKEFERKYGKDIWHLLNRAHSITRIRKKVLEGYKSLVGI